MTYIKIQGALIFVLFLIDSIWIMSSSLQLTYNLPQTLKYGGIFIFLYLAYLFYTRIRINAKIGLLFISTLYLVTFTAVALILSYLAYTIPNPLMDSALMAADAQLGFNFSSLYAWFLKHGNWNTFFTSIYNSIIFQITFIFLYFGLVGKGLYLQRFLMLFMISILPTILLGCFYPAIGPHLWLNFPPPDFLEKAISYLFELRSGVLDLTQEQGIIIFPSFHTTLSLLFIYIFRHENKALFAFFGLLNLLMIFSILVQGGHYLIDMFGGLYMFLLTIFIEGALYEMIKKYGTLEFLPSKEKSSLKKERHPSNA